LSGKDVWMTKTRREFAPEFKWEVSWPASWRVDRIRHYGLLASGSRKANVARARELLAAILSRTAAAVERRTRSGTGRGSFVHARAVAAACL